MNIFSLASAGANLTPGQRAFLKVIQALVIQALALGLLAGLAAITTYIVNASTGVPIDYIALLRLFGVACGVAVVSSFGHGLEKYLSAQGEAPLAVAVETVTNAIQARVTQPPALPLQNIDLSSYPVLPSNIIVTSQRASIGAQWDTTSNAPITK
jgi:hypothetical protein